MTHSEQEALIQLDEAGVSFQPKKKPRIAEIVAGYTVLMAAFLGVSYAWIHWVI